MKQWLGDVHYWFRETEENYSCLRKNRTLVFPRLFGKYVFQKDHTHRKKSKGTAESNLKSKFWNTLILNTRLWNDLKHIAKGSGVLPYISSKLFKKNRGSNFLQATVNKSCHLSYYVGLDWGTARTPRMLWKQMANGIAEFQATIKKNNNTLIQHSHIWMDN